MAAAPRRTPPARTAAAARRTAAHEKERADARRRPSRTRSLQAIWVLDHLHVMLAILYPTAWKNVLAGLKAREERIRRDIADAEAARAKAEATLKEYNAAARHRRGRRSATCSPRRTADGEQIADEIRMRGAAGSRGDQGARDHATSSRPQAGRRARSTTRPPSSRRASPRRSSRRNLNADDQRDLGRPQQPGASCRHVTCSRRRRETRVTMANDHLTPSPDRRRLRPLAARAGERAEAAPSRSARSWRHPRGARGREPDVRASSSPTRRSATPSATACSSTIFRGTRLAAADATSSAC